MKLEKEYNPATRPQHVSEFIYVKRYAELIRNYKKQRIKSLCDNKTEI
nr:MAG TPA: hypothetical protein [Caudoviricetes sp.]